MATDAEYVYWHECWPEAILNSLRNFMSSGDTADVLGISSLAVCHRQQLDFESAVCSLIREILLGFEEAKNIREDLKKRRLELKEMNLYDIKERKATLQESGLVSYPVLMNIVAGYRRSALEIFQLLKDAGFLRVERHSLRASGTPIDWIGLNAKWDTLVEDIRLKGTSDDMFASSLAIMLCMAIDKRGTTTVLPMVRAILSAAKAGGEIDIESLKSYYPNNIKALYVILDKQREKTEALRIFPSDDGRRLIVSANTLHAVQLCQTEANRIALARGLGV